MHLCLKMHFKLKVQLYFKMLPIGWNVGKKTQLRHKHFYSYLQKVAFE